MTEEMTRSIVVMGDMNDGPGRDKFEAEFILQNLVDVIQGTLLNPELNVYHVLDSLQTDAFSLEFEDPEDGTKKRELIDHILMGPGMFTGMADLAYKEGSGRVEHKAWENHIGSDPTISVTIDQAIIGQLHVKYSRRITTNVIALEFSHKSVSGFAGV